MRQQDLSPILPVGVVKRSDAELVRQLTETPQATACTIAIEPAADHNSRRRLQLSMALGGFAVALLSLVDWIRLGR